MAPSQRLSKPGERLPSARHTLTLSSLLPHCGMHLLRETHLTWCRFPDGMEEDLIATIAKDVLQGLEYMHDDGSMHR